ncbi:MAG: hypothetical protein PHI96_00620 [Desulfovibrio sp.]|nr:hypothetical protein [Desulfovibrio sp.]
MDCNKNKNEGMPIVADGAVDSVRHEIPGNNKALLEETLRAFKAAGYENRRMTVHSIMIVVEPRNS